VTGWYLYAHAVDAFEFDSLLNGIAALLPIVGCGTVK